MMMKTKTQNTKRIIVASARPSTALAGSKGHYDFKKRI